MDLVFGKYEIQRRVAIGGMGEVFYALQKGVPGFERPVILKSLLPDLAQQDGFIDQFLDEARVAATLNHPNVVSIFEVGQWNGTYYLAMEYIRGRNLAQVLRRSLEQQLTIPATVAVRIVRDAALGLDHAHQATDSNGEPLNIIHRDISPQNIMVREDGLTKVVDFGIARAANRATRTATGALKGKLAYMAPEQVSSAAIGPAADQFALGVVLWELLTQRRLFKADRDIDVVKKVLEEPIPLPSTVTPVPPALEAVTMRMLERVPASRFPSCAEVARALDVVLATMEGELPGDFMRRLGTDDLFLKQKATPSHHQGNFVISLKAQATPDPEEIAPILTQTSAGVKPASGQSRKALLASTFVLGLLVAIGVLAWRQADPRPSQPSSPTTAPAPVVTAAPAPVVAPVVSPVIAPTEAPTQDADAGLQAMPAALEEPAPPAAPANATVTIATTPAKAVIRLDGKPIGTSPQTVEVTPGEAHYLLIERAGYRRLEQEFRLEAGDTKTLTFRLVEGRASAATAPPVSAPSTETEPGFLSLETEP